MPASQILSTVANTTVTFAKHVTSQTGDHLHNLLDPNTPSYKSSWTASAAFTAVSLVSYVGGSSAIAGLAFVFAIAEGMIGAKQYDGFNKFTDNQALLFKKQQATLAAAPTDPLSHVNDNTKKLA